MSPGPETTAVCAPQLKRAATGSENDLIALRLGCELPTLSESAYVSANFGRHCPLMPARNEPPTPLVSANETEGV